MRFRVAVRTKSRNRPRRRVGSAEVAAHHADGELLRQLRGRIRIMEDPGHVPPHRPDVSEYQPDPGLVGLLLALMGPEDVRPVRLDLMERPILFRVIHVDCPREALGRPDARLTLAESATVAGHSPDDPLIVHPGPDVHQHPSDSGMPVRPARTTIRRPARRSAARRLNQEPGRQPEAGSDSGPAIEPGSRALARWDPEKIEGSVTLEN